MSGTTLTPEKGALREQLLLVRAALPPSFRESASRAIAARLVALPAWREARTVALYAALGAEVDTAELARLALAAGKRVAWPRTSPTGPGLSFASCAPAELVPGPARTLEPPADAPPISLQSVDLFVVPGVAFDAAGGRLGRGRGHYDAALSRIRPGAIRVGLAFDEQVVAEVPVEPHDVRLDAVVTPSVVLATGDRPG